MSCSQAFYPAPDRRSRLCRPGSRGRCRSDGAPAYTTIGGVERALTSVNADFVSFFRAARIELADDYIFLDPTSNGFKYEDSVVTLNSELPFNSYVAGLSEGLRRVVDRVATGDNARRVRERVALELFSVARKRHEILTRSGFLAQLDRIAGTKVI
jgi:hypothetical protein